MKVRTKVGSTPTMMDFIRLHAITPLAFIEYSRNYYQFKCSIGIDEHMHLSVLHLKSLDFLSKVICNGIRPYEAMILSSLMQGEDALLSGVCRGRLRTPMALLHVKRHYSLPSPSCKGVFQKAQVAAFGGLSYCEWNEDSLVPTRAFKDLLDNETYRREVDDILALGEFEYRQYSLEGRGEHDLVLYQKYTRQEVCRLLNWPKDEAATIYGYKVHRPTATCPIFVTYHKDRENIDASIDYHDMFLSRDVFQWETPQQCQTRFHRTAIYSGEEGAMQTLLFVQKSNDEGRPSTIWVRCNSFRMNRRPRLAARARYCLLWRCISGCNPAYSLSCTPISLRSLSPMPSMLLQALDSQNYTGSKQDVDTILGQRF